MNCQYSGNIPLYNEYSSLNSILMASLYSENSRDIIIKKAKTWNSSNKYKSLIKKIVNKNKRKNDISNDISLLNPDDIFIENMFFLKDKENLKTFVNELKKKDLNRIKWNDDFIIDFYRGLGLSCLDIYIQEEKHYLNLYKFINWKITNTDVYETILNVASLLSIKKENNNPQNPDVLIVFNDKLNNSIKKNYINPFIQIKNYTEYINKNFLSTDVNINKFSNIEEEININNNTYILDSILLRVDDKSIVGFRCDGEKYVYNNFSSTYDSPCSITKFDWKYNEGIFCYNPIKCDLDDDDIKDIEKLCFDFSKGDKTLIYIKKEINNVIPEIPDIPDNEIISIIKKIKDMNIAKLTEFIKKYQPDIINSQNDKIYLEKIALKIYIINYINLNKNSEPVPEPVSEPEPE